MRMVNYHEQKSSVHTNQQIQLTALLSEPGEGVEKEEEQEATATFTRTGWDTNLDRMPNVATPPEEPRTQLILALRSMPLEAQTAHMAVLVGEEQNKNYIEILRRALARLGVDKIAMIHAKAMELLFRGRVGFGSEKNNSNITTKLLGKTA